MAQQDVFCLQDGSEVSVKNDRRGADWRPDEVDPESDYDENDADEWMNNKDANDLLRQWHIKESEEDKGITSKVRRRTRKPKGQEAKEHKKKLRKQYNDHVKDERCKFRRRVQ